MDVYHNKEMDLSGGKGSLWEDNEQHYQQDYDYTYEDTTVSKDEFYKSLKIAFLTIYSLIFVLGVLGNGVVIWVTGFKIKKTINTVWYLNLAVADFLVTAFLPLKITETALDDHWPFGKFMCKLNYIVLLTSMYASVYILMVISVDRCVCVVWPVWAQNHRSVRKASCVSLGVWVLALALSSPYFIFKDTRPSLFHDGIWCYYNFFSFNQVEAMYITRVLMGFVVPFTIIVSCYSVIIYRRRRNRPLASQSGPPFKIIAAVITAFFICWAPFHIMELIVLVNMLAEYHSITVINVNFIGIPIVVCLASLNSCLNPLLYVFMGQDFKDVFRKSILKVLEKAFTEELPQTNTSTNPGITSHSKENSFSEAQL